MKKFFFILALLYSISSTAQDRCGTNELWKAKEIENPNLFFERKNIETDIQKWISNKSMLRSVSSITIPVVFHVLYKNETENVSDEQIISQLNVLNADFNRTNLDAINTEIDFLPVAANCEISFCLAQRTPENNPTSGITRTETSITSFDLYDSRVFSDSDGGKDIWDPTQYLNIYVCDLSNVLGFASFPGGNISDDGVVIDFENFGTIGTATSPYHKGRTATHEIGHWLNLYHIWGDNNCGDDLVADTPIQETENYGCPAHPSISCENEGDMFQNFMDYTNDACMNLFTNGQKERMQATLNTTRASLLQSKACQPPHEDAGIINNITPEPEEVFCGSQLEIQTVLQNFSTEPLSSVQINYSINNNNLQSYIWNGYLSSGESQVVTIGTVNITEGDHSITIFSSYPDETHDTNTSNDTLNFNFFSTNGQGFEISVMTDNYGEEVNWVITDEEDITVASEDNLLSNQLNNTNLCLIEDECYTFTIYDAYADGICCDFGNGYISINESTFSGEYNDSFSIDLCALSSSNQSITIENKPFPNPSSGKVWLNHKSNIKTLKVFSYLGEFIEEIPFSTPINLSHLKNGVYFLSFIHENQKVSTHKIIIHH